MLKKIKIEKNKMILMPEMMLMEFFPKIIVEIPESPGGSCCLKPVIKRKTYNSIKN
jgi:hypothetical protein